jgi:hypothetical protein
LDFTQIGEGCHLGKTRKKPIERAFSGHKVSIKVSKRHTVEEKPLERLIERYRFVMVSS